MESISKLTNLQELGIELHKKKWWYYMFSEEIIQLIRIKTIELATTGFSNKDASVSVNNSFAIAQAKAFLKNLLK